MRYRFRLFVVHHVEVGSEFLATLLIGRTPFMSYAELITYLQICADLLRGAAVYGYRHAHDTSVIEVPPSTSPCFRGLCVPHNVTGLFSYLDISGDIVSIYRKDNELWWFGELNGTKGRFPVSHVEEF
ncbi:nostrin [Clonorchis sinensis]|uniref:Nostrin n=1 Tax=Clonorchis sinensis TaxID=79923 RepID=G7YUN8_CLOSI|nr:nostrin [Clonorchis sinensis]